MRGIGYFRDPTPRGHLSIAADQQRQCQLDTAKAAEIWKRADQVWWPGGPDHPTLRLLRVKPRTTELWDGPASSIVAAFEFAMAKLTGTKPNLGEKVSVPMR